MPPFNPSIPFNDLKALPPAVDIETRAVLRKAISAGRALAQLNATLRNLPNPAIFLDTIYLQEAKASSEVENIITTHDDLFRSMISEKRAKDPATKEVLSYKDALQLALRELTDRPFLSTNLCIRIVQAIKGNNASIRTTPGTALVDAVGQVVYTPPTGEDRIRDMMAHWERYANTEDGIDPLLRMALIHYQFEAIHPFPDGNGRTGRILLLLYLKLSGLLDTPAIYLSEYIIAHKAEYYACLRGVTERNDWETFILYMLDMVEVTANLGLSRIERIDRALNQCAMAMRNALPKIYSRELVDILFRLPYTKRQNLVDAGIGNPKTAGNYLITLEERGFLESVKVGKEKLYLNLELLHILEGGDKLGVRG